MFMQKNLLAKALLALLLASVLINLVFSFFYLRAISETRTLQAQMAQVNSKHALVQNLVNEALDYSRLNPAIDPILYAINAKPRPATTEVKPAK
jgi:hypothetical protein